MTSLKARTIRAAVLTISLTPGSRYSSASNVSPDVSLGGRTPGSISVLPCSPGSRPLRVAFGDGPRPALGQAPPHSLGERGRGGETALDRTEKHRHDRPDGNRGLYF